MAARDGLRFVYRIDGKINHINLPGNQGLEMRERLKVLSDLRKEKRDAAGKLFVYSEHKKDRADDIRKILKEEFQIIADEDKLAGLVSYAI